MASECKIDGEYKVLVKKEVLPQFLEMCREYSSLLPEIYDEFISGRGEYWCVNFCYQKKEVEKDEDFK